MVPRIWHCLVAACLAPAVASAAEPVVGVTTGINTATGERPQRRNINDLYNEGGPSWDLYVQALDLFQKADTSDLLSYYQITGIHGLPFLPWDGVDQVSGGARSGYCPHGQVTFATWHRPFLALFEQALAGHVATVASQYPPDIADEYSNAADTFRIPYWDWAAGNNAAALPTALVSPTVSIRGPAGPVSVRNPLYSFQFPQFPFPGGEGFGGSLVQFNETKRCTVVAAGPELGVSNVTLADTVLGGHGAILQDKVYAVFTQDDTFEAMATTATSGPSFEDPHNIVHNDLGCVTVSGYTGHMLDLNWSGFDPIFMLHHANVDRLLALWQAIHYDSPMFNTTESGHAQFATAAGDVTADSPLKPFSAPADAGTPDGFHTSRSAQDIATFGYSYPELADPSLSPADRADAVRAAVNNLYGPSTTSNASKRARRQRRTRAHILDTVDFSVEVAVDRADVPLPCTLALFLTHQNGVWGNTSMAGATQIGFTSLLSMPQTGLSYATTPLRRALLAQARDRAFGDVDAVMAHLRQRLRVVITAADGTVVPVGSVPSLQIDVQQRHIDVPGSGKSFPRYGPVERCPLQPKNLQRT